MNPDYVKPRIARMRQTLDADYQFPTPQQLLVVHRADEPLDRALFEMLAPRDRSVSWQPDWRDFNKAIRDARQYLDRAYVGSDHREPMEW